MRSPGPQQHRIPFARPKAQWLRASVGGVLTLILHALLLGSLVLGTARTRIRVPNQAGAGAGELQSPNDPVMTLIVFDDPVDRSSRESVAPPLASRGSVSSDVAVTVASPDPIPVLSVILWAIST